MSEGDITPWDSQTLQELARFEAPEPPTETEYFYAAPRGHGMWFIGKTGTVYRSTNRPEKLLKRSSSLFVHSVSYGSVEHQIFDSVVLKQTDRVTSTRVRGTESRVQWANVGQPSKYLVGFEQPILAA